MPHPLAASAGDAPARLSASKTSLAVIPDDTAPDFPDLVWDGPDRRVDVDWQRSLRRLTATWASAADPESGLMAPPEVCFGTAAGLCDISGFSPAEFPHMHTYQASAPLGPGPYFATVRVRNGAGLFSDRHSDSVRLDADPPVFAPEAGVRVADASGGTTSRALAVEWDAASDAMSGVAGYDVAVGLAAGASGLVEFFDVGAAQTATLTLPPHAPAYGFYVTVRARDATGLSAYLSSGKVHYDSTLPKLARIRLSLTASRAGAFAPHVLPRVPSTDFYAFLDDCVDPETGIAQVRWWLRAAAAPAPVTPAQVEAAWQAGWRVQGLTVPSGEYRLVVELRNGAGGTAQFEAPLYVVSAGPAGAQIWDGLGRADLQYVPVGSPVGATWRGIQDPDALITGVPGGEGRAAVCPCCGE